MPAAPEAPQELDPGVQAERSAAIQNALLEQQIKELRTELEADAGDSSREVSTKPIDENGDAIPIDRQEYVQLYNTATGAIVDVLPVMLTAKLSLRWRQEHMVDRALWTSPVWSLAFVAPPNHENLVCSLHPDGNMRATADALGITTVCPRIKLPNRWVQDTHMRRKHKDEWSALERYREDDRRNEDRAVQEAHLAALERLAGAQGMSQTAVEDAVRAVLADNAKDLNDGEASAPVQGRDSGRSGDPDGGAGSDPT